jgi:hypothetical protein
LENVVGVLLIESQFGDCCLTIGDLSPGNDTGNTISSQTTKTDSDISSESYLRILREYRADESKPRTSTFSVVQVRDLVIYWLQSVSSTHR